ncbi:hypothetical protein H5410_005871 [Solanum commersonii]|uniref:Uncharacterized protein n=1 Tax=Solanum commersonii TaxID=4109 RepID=A0A9J6A7T3_SOLCO|nr:hypothetical protein H5410_005871 [Solanum commersonii]
MTNRAKYKGLPGEQQVDLKLRVPTHHRSLFHEEWVTTRVFHKKTRTTSGVRGSLSMWELDLIVEVVQDNMVGEVEGVNFNDPDYNLKEGDGDYHDVVTERRHMKAKGRPKKVLIVG